MPLSIDAVDSLKTSSGAPVLTKRGASVFTSPYLLTGQALVPQNIPRPFLAHPKCLITATGIPLRTRRGALVLTSLYCFTEQLQPKPDPTRPLQPPARYLTTSRGAMVLTRKGARIPVVPQAQIGSTILLNLEDSVSLSDSTAFSASKALSDSVTLSDSPSKSVTHVISDTITLSDAAAKGATKALSDSVTLSDTPRSSFTLNIADSVSLSDGPSTTLTPGIGLSLSDTISITEELTFELTRGAPSGPVEHPGLRISIGGETKELSLILESDATLESTGLLKIRKDGVTYVIQLVEVDDPSASPIRIQTPAGVRALKLKTT